LKAFIREWLIGKTVLGRPPIPSYYVLKSKDVSHVSCNTRKRLNEMKQLMIVVERHGRAKGVWKATSRGIGIWTLRRLCLTGYSAILNLVQKTTSAGVID
jgi:hypothetical protein